MLGCGVFDGGGGASVQIFDVLEAVSQVAEKGMVEMFQHATLANDVANALGAYDCFTASAWEASE